MPKEEFVELVDQDNNSLGIKMEKLQAHLTSRWHRTTQIWVISQTGKILVNQRSEKQFQDPGKWATFFGGHLVFGENYWQGGIREIKEELGLKVGKKRLKKIILKKNDGPKEFVQIFILRLKKNEKFSFSAEEFQQVKFVLPSKLLTWAKKEEGSFSGGLKYVIHQVSYLQRQKLPPL